MASLIPFLRSGQLELGSSVIHALRTEHSSTVAYGTIEV